MRDKLKYKEYKKQYYLNDIGRRDIPAKKKKVGKELNFYTEKKFQEEVTRYYHDFGYFKMPDKKIIEKQILKEQLLYEDTVDDVELETDDENDEED